MKTINTTTFADTRKAINAMEEEVDPQYYDIKNNKTIRLLKRFLIILAYMSLIKRGLLPERSLPLMNLMNI